MPTKTRTALIQNGKVFYGSRVWNILQRWASGSKMCDITSLTKVIEPFEKLKGSKRVIAFFEKLKAHDYKGTLLIFKESAAAGRNGNSGFQAQVIKELLARSKNERRANIYPALEEESIIRPFVPDAVTTATNIETQLIPPSMTPPFQVPFSNYRWITRQEPNED